MIDALTHAEITKHCEELLGPVTAYVAGKLGPEASDHTGMCLFTALRKYKRSRGRSVEQWARVKTLNLVIESLRALDGRKGTLRHAARAAQTTIGDFDTSRVEFTPSEALEVKDALSATLKIIDGNRRLHRWVLMAQIVGNFTNADIARLLNVTEKRIRQIRCDIRESLSTDRLPDAFRGQFAAYAGPHRPPVSDETPQVGLGGDDVGGDSDGESRSAA